MNNTFYAPNDYRYYLEHHGVKGMRWGVRRYQNADGSYTSAGRERYGTSEKRSLASRAIDGVVKYNRNVNQYLHDSKVADAEAQNAKNRAYQRDMLRAKTVRDKFGAWWGNEKTSAERLRIDAEKERKMADAADKASFKYKKYEHLTNAANAEHKADYHDKLSKMSRGQRIAEALTKKEWRNMPYTTVTESGETTITRGEKEVRDMLTYLAIELVGAGLNAAVGGRYFTSSDNREWREKGAEMRYTHHM